jgi:putative DNA primase/helicase
MLENLKNILHRAVPGRRSNGIPGTVPAKTGPSLKAIGLTEFLHIDVAPRQMLLSPILSERSLAMVYAPRGLGKSWLALSMGLSVASGQPLLRWSAPRPRSVLYIDGEMPIAALQERLKAISVSMGIEIPNDGFRILVADNVELGINLGVEDGQYALEPLLNHLDLLILDNLSTLCTSRSESASDAWVPMQNWLLKLRRQGVSVLLVHHAGVNGRQRGTSRREDALDTVIALRRPEDYSPEQGARFEIHFEKLRNRVDGEGAAPFEARVEPSTDSNGRQGIRWTSREIMPSIVKRAADLFADGLTVREVAASLRISKSEAGRLRIRAYNGGLLTTEETAEVSDHPIMFQ